MALNHVRVSINEGRSSTQEYYDARTAVSSSGFSFEPNAAYDAYKMMSSLNEDLIEITNSLLNSQELIVEINNNLELYFSSVRMLVEYADYITPFLTKFQDYISNISTIDPSFGAAFNLLVMSEGEIDLELIQNKSYKDLQQMNNDYSLICEWANKTGYEDAKKYYTLEELKKENEILYYRFMEYFNIQYWASTQGFEYGEFPCYSYSEFKRKGKIPLPKTEELRPLPLPKRSELVEYKPEDGGYLSYNTFSYEMPSLELFYFEKGIPHAKHELSELTEREATEFLEWSYWRNEEISFKVKTLGVTINSSDDARKAITQLEQSVNTLWDKVFEYKVADVGTACLNFMEDGMYNYNHQYFDEDANDYVVGYIYINAAGRKDFVMSGESNIVAADSNVDKSTVQPVYLSNYAEQNYYQEFRKQFMSDSNFEDHWYNSELYLQAVDMKQIRETKLSGALKTFNRENDTLTELKSLNSLVNDLALENVETAMTTWKPDFPELSKKIDISSKISSLLDNSKIIYDRSDSMGMGEDGSIMLSDDEALDVIYALISGCYSFDDSDSLGCLYFYNEKNEYICIYGDRMLHNYVLWSDYMSETEKSVFYYKYAKDKQDALEYLDEISQTLNNRWVANKKIKDAEYAKEHPWMASMYSVFMTPFEGLSAAVYSLGSLISDEKIYSTWTYSTGDVLRQSVASNIAVSDKTWGETLSFLYSTGMSMADSTLLLATNALTGGSMTLLLSTGLMGSRAYVSTLNDALDRGLSDGQSVALAFSAAAAESICESISVGKLLDLDNTLNAVLGNKLAGINNKTMHSIVKVLGGAVIQGVSEGQEEVCTELLNFLTDSLISGDLSSFRLSVEEKISNGYSESDAIAEATIENFEQVMLSFLGGFISGGVNGGVFTTVGTIKTENDISKIASDIDSMYKNSTTNYDIKSLQLNLRHGNYAEAFSGLFGFNGVDITNKLLASKMLYESLCASGNLDYSQHLIINSAIDGGIQQFTGLNQNQQLEQFNKLDVDNQISLLNMLNSGGISVFKSLDTEIQKNLFNNDKLDLSVKLSILSSLDANGQNLVLPQETDVLTYIANNSSDIINAQVNSLDSSIASMVSDLKKLLFNNKVQLVNEINIKYFDSLLSKAMENPSEISSLITKYSASVDSSNMDTFNQLMYLLTVEVNNRYNLMNSSDIANSIVQKNSDLDYNTVLATLIVPSNMHNSFGLDSKILYNNQVFVDAELSNLGLNSDISNIQTQIDNLSYVKTTIPQYIKNYLLSNIRKYSYKDTSNFEGLNQQIMENGLYHFTTAADAILESGYIKASGVNASYGKPKSFFFNGVPDVGAFATNLDSIPLKTTAIKVNPTEQLVNSSKLKIRYIDDMAITYDGKFDLTGYDVEKCHFILVLENGNLVYKQVSQEVYDSYETTNMAKALSDYVSNKDNVTAIKADFLVDIANKNANNGQNTENLFDTKTYSVDPTYGFQLDNSSFGEFFKAKIESGFFTSEQVKLMLERVNSKGFISENSGKYYTQLFEEGEYDIYVKTVHSSDVFSIMSEGIRCLGSSTSGYGGAPTSVSDINLGNTVTKVDGTYDLFSTLKSANGISQGMNPIDGTIVVKVPKGIDVNDIFYFNESTNTYNIKPEYVDSFSAVDSNGVVSEPLFNDMFTDILDVASDLMDFSKINIEEAHEAIIQLSDKNGIASTVDKNWIIGFYDLLVKNNVSNTQINSIMSLLLSKENINNINKCMNQFGSTAPNIVDSSSYSYFYNYLNSIESKIDSNYLETGIKYIIENNNSNTNVIDQFIKYVVVTNFDDVRYVSNLSNIAVDAINDKITGVNSFNTGAKPISIKLGDFEIAYIDDITFTDNNEIMIDEVYTRKNLTGTKLGSVMFENLFGELNSLFPGRNVVVSRIMYNNFGAMKFYEMQGGKLFQFGLNGYEQISFSEYDVSKNIDQHNLIAVYDSEQFEELSIKPIEKPVITLSDGTIITTVSDKTINGEYIDYSENGIYRWNGYSFPSHFVVKSGVSIPTQVLYDVLNDKKNNRKVFEDSKDYNGYLNNDIKEAIVDLYKISKSQNMDLSILPLFEERILSYIDYINENANIDLTKKFSSATDIAIYFGDSNLYLQSLLVQKNVNKVISLSLSQMAQLKNQLYRGDVSTINYVKSLLTESELDVYNQILSNESNSLQSSWISKLSTEERNALRNYAEMFGSIDADTALEMYGYDSNGNSYVTLTELMRAGVVDGIPSLDSAIEKFGVLPSEIVTYRGVGLEALTQQFGKIDLNNLSTLIGQVYTDKAYMSTSLLESKANAAVGKQTDVIFKITVPTDANYGAYIESQSNLNYKQLEFLIKKNSTSVIQNAYVNENGKVVIEMKLFDSSVVAQNEISKITEQAVIEAGIKDGTITESQIKNVEYQQYVVNAKEKLYNINPKLVELYNNGVNTGKNKGFFLGFEEHNFVHVTRVAETSVQVLNVFNEIVESGKLSGYGKIDSNIVYLAGLAHDLGMAQGGYYVKDGIITKIPDTDDGQIIRKYHPLNSAITVLQNFDIFGSNSELIACLALIHSKSTSGVRNVSSYSELSSMVKLLYECQICDGSKIYNFDASKLVKTDSNGKPLTQVISENGMDVEVYIFNEGVVESFRTGAVTLRVGDAHANKTGFNHGGGDIIIEKTSDGTVTLANPLLPISDLCNQEAAQAQIKISYSDGVLELSGGSYDFSKRIVLGERNTYTLDTKNVDGTLVYTHVVKTTGAPACTWEHGISEKFGEYKTFKDVNQKVVIQLPADSSAELVNFYKQQAMNYMDSNQWLTGGIKIVVDTIGEDVFGVDTKNKNFDDGYELKDGESLSKKIGFQFFGGTSQSFNNFSNKISNDLLTKIETANQLSEYGGLYTFEIDDFGKIPTDFWSMIDAPSLAVFKNNGKYYSFEDAKKLSLSSNITLNMDTNINATDVFNNMISKLGNNVARKALWFYATMGDVSQIPLEFRTSVKSISVDTINDFLESYKNGNVGVDNNIDINYNINNLQSAIDVVDSVYGKNAAINQLYSYLTNGLDSSVVAVTGNLRNIVTKMDYNMLVECYNTIVNSQSEIRTIKNEILENMPQGLDKLSMARYLYLELNKRISYDVGYFKSEQSVKNGIYNTDVTFDSLVGNKVVCRGWSQLFQELLLSAGIDSSCVKIQGSNTQGAHKWVEIEFDNYIIRADATDAFNHNIDLSASKSGFSTNGFIAIDKSLSGVNISKAKYPNSKVSIYEDLKANMDNTWLRDIDNRLGYTQNGQYFNETVNSLIESFYSPSLVEKIFGVNQDNLLNSKIKNLFELTIDKSMNSYDAYAYLRQVRHALFGKNSNNTVSIHLYGRNGSSTSAPVGILFVLKQEPDGSVIARILDDEKGESRIRFDNLEQYSNYIRNMSYVGIGS